MARRDTSFGRQNICISPIIYLGDLRYIGYLVVLWHSLYTWKICYSASQCYIMVYMKAADVLKAKCRSAGMKDKKKEGKALWFTPMSCFLWYHLTWFWCNCRFQYMYTYLIFLCSVFTPDFCDRSRLRRDPADPLQHRHQPRLPDPDPVGGEAEHWSDLCHGHWSSGFWVQDHVRLPNTGQGPR